MSQAKKGDTVKVHFTGKLENGEVIGTSKYDQPLEFTIGSDKINFDLDKATEGMEIGDTKTVTIPPEEAYGPRLNELILEINKGDLPETIKPIIGQKLEILNNDSKIIKVIIAGINKDTITLDANHPLAGKTLIVDIELIAIE